MSEWITETVHGAKVKGGVSLPSSAPHVDIVSHRLQSIEANVDGKNLTLDVQQLRNHIPKHCLTPSTFRSLAFVIRDLAIFCGILALALYLERRLGDDHQLARLLVCYIVYPCMAGLPLTGLWVLAHECGHGAFSTSTVVANSVGWTIHSALMSPYFSWRSSHGRHHQFANNMATDLNYVPPARDEYSELFRGRVDLEHLAEDAPVVVLLRILLQQLIGWPWYLLTHITAAPSSSPKKSRGWWDNSHFLPGSSLFRSNEFWSIVASDLGILMMCAVVYGLGQTYGARTIIWAYAIPLMWVNHWIGEQVSVSLADLESED
jgi:bifunctional Delta-12/omega-3 fatty acid desaturase